jgi:hypothetical protein
MTFSPFSSVGMQKLLFKQMRLLRSPILERKGNVDPSV